ncbi:MAG: tetratricopeptide repeat protein [Isosphaeraceae bacterium]
MIRESEESGHGRMRRGFAGLLATIAVGITICSTAAAQDDGSKPPDLIPLSPAGPLKPLSELHYPPLGSEATNEADRGDPRSYFENSHVDSLDLTTAGTDREKKPTGDDTLSRWQETTRNIAYWDEEILTHPDQANGYFQRAVVRATATRSDDRPAMDAVIADLNETLKRDPNHIEALALRGAILVELNDNAGIADLDRVLQRSPNDVPANLARARAHYRNDDLDAALRQLDRVVNASGAFPTSVKPLRARWLAEKGQYSDAIASLTEFMASEAFEAEKYLERAVWYHKLGETESARTDVAEYIRLRRGDLNSRAAANLVLLQIGEFGSAYLDAESLRRDHPDHPFPYLLRFAARYMDACRRDRFLRQVEKVAGRAEVLLPVQPIPQIVCTSVHAMTGVGRELALKDMDHGLDLIPDLSFPHACGVIVNACEGRLIPTCRDLVIFAVRLDHRQYRFEMSLNRKRRRLNFSLTEHCTPAEKTTQAEQPGGNPVGERVRDIILTALASDASSKR